MASASLSERPPARQAAVGDEDKDKDDQLVPAAVVGIQQDALYNARVRKTFGSRVFWGTIMGCYWISGGLFYKVSFDDGDVDIFEAGEALEDVKQARAHSSEDTRKRSDAVPAAANATAATTPASASNSRSPTTYHSEMRHHGLKRKRDDMAVDGQPNLRRVQLWGQRLYASIFTNNVKETFIKELLKTSDGEPGEMEATGQVKVGDLIVAVNGTRALGLMTNQVSDLIRKAQRPVWITFYRPTPSQVAHQFSMNAQSASTPSPAQTVPQTPVQQTPPAPAPAPAPSSQPSPSPDPVNQQPVETPSQIQAAGRSSTVSATMALTHVTAPFPSASGGGGHVTSLPQTHVRPLHVPFAQPTGPVGPMVQASAPVSFPVNVAGYPLGAWTMNTFSPSSFQPIPTEQFGHIRRATAQEFGHSRWNRERQVVSEQIPLNHSVPGRRSRSTRATDNIPSSMKRHDGGTASTDAYSHSQTVPRYFPPRSNLIVNARAGTFQQGTNRFSRPSPDSRAPENSRASRDSRVARDSRAPEQTRSHMISSSFLRPEPEDPRPTSAEQLERSKRRHPSNAALMDAASVAANADNSTHKSSTAPPQTSSTVETTSTSTREMGVKPEKTVVDVDADAAAIAALTEPELEATDDAMDATVGQSTSFLHPTESSFVSNLPSTTASRPPSASFSTASTQEAGNGIVVTIQRPRLYITLGPQGSFVAVTSFVRDEHGRRGEIEESGKVFIGDVLVGINSAKIKPMTTPSDVVRVVNALPRPLVLSFERASWDVLEGKQ